MKHIDLGKEKQKKNTFSYVKNIYYQTKLGWRGKHIMNYKHLPVLILKVNEQYRIT